MRKQICIIIACLLLATGMASGKSVVLTLSNGKLAYYLLGGDKDPVMRFADGKIVMNADEYSLSGIKNFYISETDDPTGIETVLKEQNVSYKAGTFAVLADNSESVSVYTANGIKVAAQTEHANGVVTVNLQQLPQGAYVIRVGESSFKVYKQ